MLGLGTFLAKFFVGGGLSSITDAIERAHQRKLAAATNSERLEAEQEIEQLRARRDVLLAEIGTGGLKSWIRPLFGLVALLYVAKAIAWDKVFCEFVGWACKTDPINDPFLGWAMTTIIAAYFLDRTVKFVARTRAGGK